MLRVLQRRLVYFPDRSAPSPPSALGAADVRLHTADGLVLGAWLVPAHGPNLGATVLVANGNAGNRADRVPLARGLSEAGLSVLLFDYRGFGENRGTPSQAGLARDVRAARAFLLEEAGVPSDRLLYLGESLGSAVVTELATEHPPAGLVLRSPFLSLTAVGRVHYPFLPATLVRDRYPLADHLRRVHAPTSVVYGTADEIVPPQQSAQVAALSGNLVESVAVRGARHNDPALVCGPALVRAATVLALRPAD